MGSVIKIVLVVALMTFSLCYFVPEPIQETSLNGFVNAIVTIFLASGNVIGHFIGLLN